MNKKFHIPPSGDYGMSGVLSFTKIRNWMFFSLTAILFAACHKETKVERYAREAKETTEQCPMAIDACTVMDSMTYTATTNCFTYYYKVSGIADSILKANEPILRQQIRDRLLNTTDMLPYVQDKVSFRYVYRTETTNAPVLDFVYENSLLQNEE